MKKENKILRKKDLKKIGNRLRSQGKKIVFCSGCFDILHAGHVVFFRQCKRYGDVLIVSVGSDRVVKKLKGLARPINREANRLFLVSSLNDVDYALLGEEDFLPGKIDFLPAIRGLMPDVFVFNKNDSGRKEKISLCASLGIKTRMVARVVPRFLKLTSSTEIIKKIGYEEPSEAKIS